MTTNISSCRYVKMYLLYNGQRIAKKKTHVKKRTLNPVFNESFVFEVPAAPNATLDHVSLELLVLDWDRVTKNEVHCIILTPNAAEEVAKTLYRIKKIKKLNLQYLPP